MYKFIELKHPPMVLLVGRFREQFSTVMLQFLQIKLYPHVAVLHRCVGGGGKKFDAVHQQDALLPARQCQRTGVTHRLDGLFGLVKMSRLQLLAGFRKELFRLFLIGYALVGGIAILRLASGGKKDEDEKDGKKGCEKMKACMKHGTYGFPRCGWDDMIILCKITTFPALLPYISRKNPPFQLKTVGV